MLVQEGLQKICGAFRACDKTFKELVPAGFYTKVEKEIQSTCLGENDCFAMTKSSQLVSSLLGLRFMHRHADAELLSLLTTTAPPADLNKVSMYSTPLQKFREEARIYPKD